MNAQKTLSLQEIIRQRQQDVFVGRQEHTAVFRQNLLLPLDDELRRFVFSVSGQGGVGKSELLKRFRQLAEDIGAITVLTDESVGSVHATMRLIAQQLEQQGHLLKTFSERYRTYRQRKQELEADADAPQGLSSILGSTLAKAGLGLIRSTPVGGAVLGVIDEDTLSTQMGEWTSYVTRKLANKDEAQLILVLQQFEAAG
jgi:hypothetical protein